MPLNCSLLKNDQDFARIGSWNFNNKVWQDKVCMAPLPIFHSDHKLKGKLSGGHSLPSIPAPTSPASNVLMFHTKYRMEQTEVTILTRYQYLKVQRSVTADWQIGIKKMHVIINKQTKPSVSNSRKITPWDTIFCHSFFNKHSANLDIFRYRTLSIGSLSHSLDTSRCVSKHNHYRKFLYNHLDMHVDWLYFYKQCKKNFINLSFTWKTRRIMYSLTSIIGCSTTFVATPDGKCFALLFRVTITNIMVVTVVVNPFWI